MKKILFLFSIVTIVSVVYCSTTWAEQPTITFTINNDTGMGFNWSNGNTVIYVPEHAYPSKSQQCKATITKNKGKYTITINPDQLFFYNLSNDPIFFQFNAINATITEHSPTKWGIHTFFSQSGYMPMGCDASITVTTSSTGEPTGVTITLTPYSTASL